MIYKNALEMVGNTPIIQLDDLSQKNTNIYIKLEKFNPAGSVKDRIAYEIIESSEKEGLLSPEKVLIEPTSGNTGIGLAFIGALKGYKVILVMPDNMSKERVSLMKAYGAEIIFTEAQYGMKGAIQKATEIFNSNPEQYFMPMQFENKFNVKAHYEHTAAEILADVPQIDALVLGVGTSGSLTGISKRLKEQFPDLKVFAVEPSASPVLSGQAPGKHKIQGIGAGFVPELFDRSLVDDIIPISDEEAFATSKQMAHQKGILVGISSGANIAASIKIANTFDFKHIVTLAPDGGEKYFSMDLFE